MNISSRRLEQAELIILTESPEFKSITKDLARLIEQYRHEEHSSSYLAKYTIDIYDDGSGAIYNGKDYLEKSIVDFPD
jgi:hypothetical protein